MNDERVERLIADLDVPVEPRREFAEVLLARLERELERPLPRAGRLPWIEHRPRNVFYAAAALVVLIVATIVIALPTRASAASTLRQAQQDIARLSQVRATIRYDINPDGSAPQIAAPGTTADVEVTYVRGVGYRQQLVAIFGSIPGIANAGGSIVWDGTYLGTTWSSGRPFVFATRADFEPLRDLGWNSPYPDWEGRCTRGGSELLADAVVAGRAARHVRCGDLYGGFWELWIDRETGFMLKIQGALGRDDFKLGTSAKGGFEVTRIEYEFDVDRSLFVVPTPPGGVPTRPPATTQTPASSPDPYARTSVRQGEIAPPWSGQLIDGGTFRLEETRGRPLLVLFWADWCPRGDPACDVLRQFDEVSRRYAGRAHFVSVDLGGTADAARKILSDLGYSFPVVVTGAQERIWDVDVIPLWVVLDRDGRVVEVRLRPQTVPQLETMLRAVGL